MNKPLNTDDEIRSLIQQKCEQIALKCGNYTTEAFIPEYRQIYNAILADRKKHELQARIDELEKYRKHYNDDWDGYADTRIAELKQELESYEN